MKWPHRQKWLGLLGLLAAPVSVLAVAIITGYMHCVFL